MKNTWLKLLCTLLALCTLLSVVACRETTPAEQPDDPTPGVSDEGGENDGDVPVDTTPDDDPTPPADDEPKEPDDSTEVEIPEDPNKLTPNASYILVRSENSKMDEMTATQLVWRGLRSTYSGAFTMKTDFVPRDATEIERAEYEILIGATNRPESQEVLATLSHKDWCYKIVNKNVIVICGGSPETTLVAAKAFLRDLIGYEENVETKEVITAGTANVLDVGASYEYRYEFPVTSFTIGAHSIKDYTVVTSTKVSAPDAAKQLTSHFLDLMGYEIPVVTLEEYNKGEGGPAIFLGCADTEDMHMSVKPYGKDRYYIFESGDNIIIDFIAKSAATGAVARFLEECTPEELTETISVSLPTEDPITGFHIPKGTNSLDLNEVTTKEVAPGVVYEEHLYYDPNGKPVRAYMITVAKGAATIATCLPGDKEKIGTYATVLDQLQSAQDNGKNVVAGINADFFGNTMLGVCVRDGKELHGVSGRPWFGILDDGTAVIGVAGEYSRYANRLVTAVGGSNVMVDGDYVTHISIDDEFGYTRHPRTAVGIKADGSVVLLVVDGRQSKISNGAALADLADILGSVGCVDAINLDGGGSSTFVLKEGDELCVKNSPSDGSLRDVADGLMVILP